MSKSDRPENCRNRLQDEGKPHPKSGCAHCKTGGITGCPFEKEASGTPYYAKDGKVWKSGESHPSTNPNATVLIAGFPVCEMTPYAGDEAAETVAALMNLGHVAASPETGGCRTDINWRAIALGHARQLRQQSERLGKEIERLKNENAALQEAADANAAV